MINLENDKKYHLCNIYQDSENYLRLRFLIPQFISLCMTACSAIIKTFEKHGTMDDLYTSICFAEYIPSTYDFCTILQKSPENKDVYPRAIFVDDYLHLTMSSTDFIESWVNTARELMSMKGKFKDDAYCIEVGVNTECDGYSFEMIRLLP